MITVTKVNGYNRSCNECQARNYKSKFDPPEAKQEDIYELSIGTFCIALCRKCMTEVNACVAEYLDKN
ncbi:MAG: hypothetical protein E7544_09145 [Ruminococcaceae bacterium]|nr:hypothetical protein [Oscillospiraceae bacterium]